MKQRFSPQEDPIPVAAPEAYPTVTAHAPDRRAVQLLLSDIAYSKGEMTAACQYLYQHWMFEEAHPRLADTLLRIAKVEMRHLDILGAAARSLGGDPRFCCVQRGACQGWSGGLVHYGGAPRQMLQWDLEAERDAADLYLSQARFLRDDNLSAILTRLAADEKLHARVIKEFLDRLPGQEDAGRAPGGRDAKNPRR